VLRLHNSCSAAERHDAPMFESCEHFRKTSSFRSIVRVDTYTLVLKEQYRRGANPSASAVKSAASANSYIGSGKGRPPTKSGGAARWFLFLMKVIGVLAFIAFAVAAFVSLATLQNTSTESLGGNPLTEAEDVQCPAKVEAALVD
jgi:hypothetical protein